MSDTNFANQVTVVATSWFQDVNNAVYRGQFPANTTLAAHLGSLASDVGILGAVVGSSSTYNQFIIANYNNGVVASADLVLANNLTTATTYYGDLGINASAFSGAGSLSLPNATYLYSANGDLVLGTLTANTIRFVTNNGTTDAMEISPSGQTSITALANTPVSAANGNTVEATSGPGGTQLGWRNRVINGSFSVNQRAIVSPVTAAAGAYGFDRWKAGASGATYSFVSPSGQYNFLTITAGSLQQVIEQINILAGTYTLSWIGTSTAKVNGTTVANGGQVTIPGTGNVTVEFATGTLSLAQLEPGTVATPFEYRSIAAEVLLCQRYFYAIGLSDITALAATTTSLLFGHNHPTTMRAAPTLQVATAIGSVQTSGGTSTSYTLAQDATTTTMAGYFLSGMNNGPTAAYQAARVQGGVMWWSAEL